MFIVIKFITASYRSKGTSKSIYSSPITSSISTIIFCLNTQKKVEVNYNPSLHNRRNKIKTNLLSQETSDQTLNRTLSEKALTWNDIKAQAYIIIRQWSLYTQWTKKFSRQVFYPKAEKLKLWLNHQELVNSLGKNTFGKYKSRNTHLILFTWRKLWIFGSTETMFMYSLERSIYKPIAVYSNQTFLFYLIAETFRCSICIIGFNVKPLHPSR